MSVGISRERVENILQNDLGMTPKVSARWVPRLLTPDHVASEPDAF